MTTQHDSDVVIAGSADPWDVVADTAAEAENLRVRSDLMDAVIARIDEFGWTQAVAATHLGVTQPRVSDLYRGKIDKFSLDALANLACSVGVHLTVVTTPQTVSELPPSAAPW